MAESGRVDRGRLSKRPWETSSRGRLEGTEGIESVGWVTETREVAEGEGEMRARVKLSTIWDGDATSKERGKVGVNRAEEVAKRIMRRQ